MRDERAFMKRLQRLILVLLSAVLIAGGSARAVPVVERDGFLLILTSGLVVKYDLARGRFDIQRTNGEIVITEARSEAKIIADGEKHELTHAGAEHIGWYFEEIEDYNGKGIAVNITRAGDEVLPDLVHVFRVYDKKPYMIVSLSLENVTEKTIGVEKLVPLMVDGGEGGGLFLGLNAKNIKILENGHRNQFDFWVRLVSVKEGSDSNWSSALFDTKSRRGMVGGFLTQESSLGSVLVSHVEDRSATDQKTGRRSLSRYVARASFSPVKLIKKYNRFDADPFFIAFSWEEPFAELEQFARCAGAESGLDDFERRQPALWDTWYSSMQEDITEENILGNLEVAARELAPYGLDTLVVDAGWERARGDWFPNGKFPSGMKSLADAIRESGMRPGIWIAPFMATDDTPVFKAHPDWFLSLDTYGGMIIGKGTHALDISNPEVLEWIGGCVERLTREWGYELIKVDFTYYSLTGRKYFQRGGTRGEYFRAAFRAMREAAGPDVFINAVGVPLGYHLGVVDGMRTGLDTTPRWGEGSGYSEQGFRPTYRNMIRRYFLNGRTWSNDPDVVYTGLEETYKRWGQEVQPRNELIALISAVGLTGQIVGLADQPKNMSREQLDMIRAVLPAFHTGARPLDLFEKDLPEILHLPISGAYGSWSVAGLFNWGANTGPDGEIQPAARVVQLPFDALGMKPNSECHVYDFWSGKYMGRFKAGYAVRLEPGSAAVISVRPALDRPQLIASNRSITMGATDIKSVQWDKIWYALEGIQSAVPGFDYELVFYVPEGYSPKKVSLSAGELDTEQSEDGRLLFLRFSPTGTDEITWRLLFNYSDPARQDVPPDRK